MQSVGGAFFPDNPNVTIQYSRFKYNAASYYGGSIHSEDGNNIVMKNSVMSNNSAKIGGALHVGSIASVINIKGK